MSVRRVAFAVCFAAGCLPSVSYEARPLENVAIPVRDTTPKPRAVVETKEPPPPSGPARPFRFPPVITEELPAGLKLATIVNRSLPVVELRVAIPGGVSADEAHPGVAALTAEVLREGGAGGLPGREILGRIEALGATLSVRADRDATTLGLTVTRDRLAEALGLLALIVQRPGMSPTDVRKAKKRLIERTEDSARGDGRWAALMTIYRDLYSLPAEQHPYAAYAATPSELAKLTVADCRAYHRRFFVPSNTLVVVAGDTTPEATRAAVEKAFRDRRKGAAPALSFTDPLPPESLKITLIDRPKSAQSDIYVAVLGPPRADGDWPAFALASEVLGALPAGRLFTDVREQQGLANTAFSSPVEVAHGPGPLLAYAGTRPEKTGLALKALLEHTARLAETAPDDEEVELAIRHIADSFAVRMQGAGALADEIVRLRVLGLPDDENERYRKELRDVTPALVGKVAGEYVRAAHAIVAVAGDAAIIGPQLSHFGEVKVVDAARDFERERTIPMNAGAPIE